MPAAAPRIDPRLVAAAELIDDASLPIAEVNRRVGEVALRYGLTKPSYEQIRVRVHTARRLGRAPTTGEILLDIMFRVRAPEDLVDHLSGVGVRDLRAK